MKRLILVFAVLAALVPLISGAWTVPDETLRYRIKYKWGFLDANAGVATITTEKLPGTDSFRATLTGQSVDLLGHYYGAGDTIVGTLMADTLRSVSTQRLTHADGVFEIETVTYPDAQQSEGQVVRQLPGGKVLRERISHYGGGLTLDLLGVYYYMRQIDYGTMQQGQSVTVNIFSGKTPETLRVTYNGPVTADSCGVSVPAYSVSLDFSTPTPGGPSDQLTAVVSASAARVPLQIAGTLKFGRIDCTLESVEP
ncbi:MAG: DUF3108 domain-containing protein [Muribaculaceae bacterium]|nr:DUF3108 domain-containing protein [Muribaculaceae bacterium]